MVERGELSVLDRDEIRDILFDRERFMRKQAGIPEVSNCELSHLTVRAHDGTGLNCRIYSADPAKPHIVYYPAEYESEETLYMLADGMGAYGFNLASLDYRGLGRSQGAASLDHLSRDAAAFFAGIREWIAREGRADKLVIMGRSLGTAAAIMAAEKFQNEILCLVLESAFNLTSDFLLGRGVSQELVSEICPDGSDPFGNRQRMKKIEKPVLFIHSPRDQVQTLSQVEWLVMESRSKATQFQVAPSGTREDLAHCAGELYCSVLHQYINLRMGIRPPRKPRHKRKAQGA